MKIPKRMLLGTLVATFLIGNISGYALGNIPIPNDIDSEVTPETQVYEIVSQETSSDYILLYYDCPLDYELQDYIRTVCKKECVPMSLVMAMIEVESGFKENVISTTNDYGLMQINAVNHEWLSEKYEITDFLDPYQNVLCGIKIISEHLSKTGGDIPTALMRYNLGASGAKRLWDDGVYETQYTRKIMTAYERYRNEI